MSNTCGNTQCRYNKQFACLKSKCAKCSIWQSITDFLGDIDYEYEEPPETFTDEEIQEIDEKLKEIRGY